MPAHPRRLVFLGTPAMAVPPLRALVAAGYDVALVVTRPDKRRGRGSEPAPSPVKAAAVELGLPVTHRVDDALDAGADLGVVVAYGALIKAHVLAELPMVNLHFSLLPRWRGAAPVERALLAGDAETGVCVMQLEEGLDTGPVFACERRPIGPDQTADGLRAELVEAGTAPARRHPRRRAPRRPASGRRRHLRRQDRARRPPPRLGPTGGRAGPHRAPGRGVDHLPGQAAEGAGRPPRAGHGGAAVPASSTATGPAPATASWC